MAYYPIYWTSLPRNRTRENWKRIKSRKNPNDYRRRKTEINFARTMGHGIHQAPLLFSLHLPLSFHLSPFKISGAKLIISFNLSGEKSHRPSKKHKSSAKVWIRMIFQLLLQFVWYSFYSIKHLMQESIPVEDYEAYVGGEEIDDDVRGDGSRLLVLSFFWWCFGI